MSDKITSRYLIWTRSYPCHIDHSRKCNSSSINSSTSLKTRFVGFVFTSLRLFCLTIFVLTLTPESKIKFARIHYTTRLFLEVYAGSVVNKSERRRRLARVGNVSRCYLTRLATAASQLVGVTWNRCCGTKLSHVMVSHTRLTRHKQAVCFLALHVMSSSFKRDFACCWLALKV